MIAIILSDIVTPAGRIYADESYRLAISMPEPNFN
jgi:hypothetical protein